MTPSSLAERFDAQMALEKITMRPIAASDAATVADLHTASWRSAYRGMLRDEYLDGDIASERLRVWMARLTAPVDTAYGFIVEIDGPPAGFVYLFGEAAPTWGTLIDNLHVLPGLKGRGIGRALLNAAAIETDRRHPGRPVHLFVYEKNLAARRFYASIGGREVERDTVEAPGGGSLIHCRVVWRDATRLMTSATLTPQGPA
jgi:ribosomal protein S18 acetylase RimI-like enzyme